MSLGDAVIHHVAAEDDWQRRLKLAVAMLTGQETPLLSQTYDHAMRLILGKTATEQERSAAAVAVQALGAVLLGRVDAMEAEIERLLDEVVDLEERDPQHDPPYYDPDEGLTVVLEPDDDDSEDQRDLALDLRAEPGRIWLRLRSAEEGVGPLTGWLPPEVAHRLGRYLEIVTADAEDEGNEEGEAE